MFRYEIDCVPISAFSKVCCVENMTQSRKRSCLFAFAKKKNRQRIGVQKNFDRCGRKKFRRVTKARIFISKKCGCKNLELKDTGRVVARRGKRR